MAMKTENIIHAYVGIKDGSIRAIVVDDTRYPDDTAEMISDWIKQGRTVERLPLGAALARMGDERFRRLTSAMSEKS